MYFVIFLYCKFGAICNFIAGSFKINYLVAHQIAVNAKYISGTPDSVIISDTGILQYLFISDKQH